MKPLAKGTKVQFKKKFGKYDMGTIAEIGYWDPTDREYSLLVDGKQLPGQYPWKKDLMEVVIKNEGA